MAGEPVITIVGNVGNDPELRFTPSGAAVASFNVAVASRKKVGDRWEDDGTTWYRCNVWREHAENIAESFRKGDRVIVQGRLKQREYELKDGSVGRSLEVEVDAAGPDTRWAQTRQRRAERSGGEPAPQQQRQAPQRQQQPADPWDQPPQRAQQRRPQAQQGSFDDQGPGIGGGSYAQQGFSDEPPFHHPPHMDEFHI